MNILIAGGTGFIGTSLIKEIISQNLNINISILTRDKTKAIKTFDKFFEKAFGKSFSKILEEKNKTKINFYTWHELLSKNLNLNNLKLDIIINLCGVNIGAKRWSKSFRQEIINSRVIPTNTLVNIAIEYYKNTGNKVAIYNASAIGYYGLSDPDRTYTEADININKNKNINKAQKPDFLSEVAGQWEGVLQPAKDAGLRVVTLRFGVVLDLSAGALKKMLLPFKLGFGGRVGSGKQAFSWIAIHDLTRILIRLIYNKQITGPINLVAPNIITQYELAQALAKYLKRPCFMPLPSFLVKLLFGQMAKELLLSGQKVKSNHLENYYPSQNWQCPTIEKFFEYNN